MSTMTKKSVRKMSNEAQAKKRLEALQAVQAKANALREQYGYVGNNPEAIIRQHEAALAAILRAEVEGRQAKYVNESLAGPSSKVLVRWLNGRPASYKLVSRFFEDRPLLQRVGRLEAA